MTAEEFEGQLHTRDYQLFLFCSPLKFPLSFAVHTWFVAVEHGVATRWEILFESEYSSPSWGHLHKNAHPPHAGITKAHFSSSRWPSTLLASWDGAGGSLVEKLVSFLNNRVQHEYPYTHQYVLPGPNSNTFTKWVLSNVGALEFHLPMNAFGHTWREREDPALSAELEQRGI